MPRTCHTFLDGYLDPARGFQEMKPDVNERVLKMMTWGFVGCLMTLLCLIRRLDCRYSSQLGRRGLTLPDRSETIQLDTYSAQLDCSNLSQLDYPAQLGHGYSVQVDSSHSAQLDCRYSAQLECRYLDQLGCRYSAQQPVGLPLTSPGRLCRRYAAVDVRGLPCSNPR